MFLKFVNKPSIQKGVLKGACLCFRNVGSNRGGVRESEDSCAFIYFAIIFQENSFMGCQGLPRNFCFCFVVRRSGLLIALAKFLIGSTICGWKEPLKYILKSYSSYIIQRLTEPVLRNQSSVVVCGEESFLKLATQLIGEKRPAHCEVLRFHYKDLRFPVAGSQG